MRRTRHVVLPVRSWQYIGLLIVSLACLTLGLVSRDREGHSGSLAGPELSHQAPHEVDACPNLNAITKILSCPIAEPEEPTKPVDDHKTGISEFRVLPASQRSVFSRSLSLDRSSRIGSQEIREQSRNRDLRAADRLSRTRVSDDETNRRLRESRSRMTARSRDTRNSFDASRSRDLPNRATDRRSAEQRSRNLQNRLTDRMNSRFEDRRSRSTERREVNEIERRQDRVKRSMDSRNSLSLQRRTSLDRDRRLLSMEQRLPSEINRQESRKVSRERREYRDLARDRVDRQSEMREHRSSRREDRRNLLDRSARIARDDIDRNNNLDRRNRERSIEVRRALPHRVADQVRKSSVTTIDSRRDLTRSNNRHSVSRSVERLNTNDLSRETLNRQVRSIDSNEKSSDRRLSSERRSSVRSMERREINHLERQKDENRRSLDRARVLPADSHRRIVSQRDFRENRARENSRAGLTRSRYDFEEIASREQRLARSSRSVDSNAIDRREFARIRDSRDHERKVRDSSAARRDLSLERRERTNRLQRSREERRIVAQKSRETERRLSERISERRFSDRRVTADSARLESRGLSERRIDDSLRSREGSRMTDRRLERSPELRISRERILERRLLHSQRFDRRIDDSSKSRERSRVADQRVDRSRELQISREKLSEGRRLENPNSREGSRMQNRVRINSELRNSMRMMERRANSGVFSENKIVHSSEGRSNARHDLHIRNEKERGIARSAETPDKGFIRQQRQTSANLDTTKKPSRLISLHRVVGVSRTSNQVREQSKLSAERTLSKNAENNRLSARWKRNLQDTRIDRNVEIWTKTASLKDYGFLKYLMNYDLVKQAFLVALCTVYGFSLYNGKKSYISSNIVQRMQRFIIW